jgi:hypothetical protein
MRKFFGAAGVVGLDGRGDNIELVDHSAATLIVIGIVIGGIGRYTVSTDLMERLVDIGDAMPALESGAGASHGVGVPCCCSTIRY